MHVSSIKTEKHSSRKPNISTMPGLRPCRRGPPATRIRDVEASSPCNTRDVHTRDKHMAQTPPINHVRRRYGTTRIHIESFKKTDTPSCNWTTRPEMEMPYVYPLLLSLEPSVVKQFCNRHKRGEQTNDHFGFLMLMGEYEQKRLVVIESYELWQDGVNRYR